MFQSVRDTVGFSCRRGANAAADRVAAVLLHKGCLCLKRPLSVPQHQLTPPAPRRSHKTPLYAPTAHNQREMCADGAQTVKLMDHIRTEIRAALDLNVEYAVGVISCTHTDRINNNRGVNKSCDSGDHIHKI